MSEIRASSAVGAMSASARPSPQGLRVRTFRQRIRGFPVFPVACLLLGGMAFSQLIIAGMALAVRFEKSREVRIVEKEVPRIVTVQVPTQTGRTEGESAIIMRPPVDPAAPRPVTPEVVATPVEVPAISDPRSERLVKEGRKARIAGDMGTAIVKLEESLKQSPDDPSVNYELGLTHESMGIFDKASDFYQKVFGMGIDKAGKLYELAGGKLSEGLGKVEDMTGSLALGRVQIFKDLQNENGGRVILTVPLQKAPDAAVETGEIEVKTYFFNRSSKGEVSLLPPEQEGNVTTQWPAAPYTWPGGEMKFRITYAVPTQDAANEELFGKSTYYGQVLTLYYKGEILDVQAWPRELAARISQPATPQPPATNDQSPEILNLPPMDLNLADPGSVLPRK